ncbi:MAG: hypothetical protein NC201_01355 [Prevotella sp.]|nr:hypothetical protein [Bacteroides sp.]MCM1365874.1 hypothetical protein [Prevotella sp.]
MRRAILTFTIFLFAAILSFAEGLVIVHSESKLYDQPSMKGYVTLNRNNEEVIITPGMVFISKESKNGWTRIEYVPGLSAYVLDSHLNDGISMPEPGRYFMNNGEKKEYEISKSTFVWQMKSVSEPNDVILTGKSFGNVVVFFDKFSNPLYTLTKVNGETYLYTYDPAVTKFL